MQVPDDILFTIMLYSDFKTLRRMATTCKSADKIHRSAYFLDAITFVIQPLNIDLNINKAKRDFKFNDYIVDYIVDGNEYHDIAFNEIYIDNGRVNDKYIQEYYGVVTNKNYINTFMGNNYYLDDYILPPRTIDDGCDRDEFIYRDIMTEEELDAELNEYFANENI